MGNGGRVLGRVRVLEGGVGEPAGDVHVLDGSARSVVRLGGDTGSDWLWLGGLMLLALVLRSIGLNSGVWLDEMYTLQLAVRPPLAEILTVYKGDNQHQLFSLLAHLSITVFGEAPWSLRLPAVLFGVASVPMLYLLGRLVASRREALWAAALLTLSYHHVWFSQNGRGYTMLAFFAIASTYLLLRGSRERRPSLFLGYGALIALGLYVNVTMLFMVAAHALACGWLVIQPRRRIASGRTQDPRLDWRLPVLAYGAGGVLTLALYAPILGEVLDFFTNRPSRLLGVSTPAWALQEAVRILSLGSGAGAGMWIGGGLFAVGSIGFLLRQPLAFALFVMPGVVTLLGALAARGTMYPRFYFFMIGFALLILARGIRLVSDAIATRAPRPLLQRGPALGTVLVVLILIAFASSLRYNYAYPKQDFVGAMQFVEATAGPADVVAVTNASRYAYNEFFGKPWREVLSAQDVQQIRRDARNVVMVYTFPRYVEHNSPDLLQLIREECIDVNRFDGTVGDGDIIVCRFPAG